MGYDINRFKSRIPNEVICCICFGVLESPFEVIECGHLFCEACIVRWISQPFYSTSTCPIDRNDITIDDIRPAPEFVTQYIGKLKVKCDFAEQGCIMNVQLCELNHHRIRCPLNPKKPICCTRGCGVRLPPSEMLNHHCDLDMCQDAIEWNDIFEDAKMTVRKRKFERYQNRHNLLGRTYKKFFNFFTSWMADPRIQSAATNMVH